MNKTEPELERLEAELLRVRPAAIPPALKQRLGHELRRIAAAPSAPERQSPAPAGRGLGLAAIWSRLAFRWVIPLAGAALLALLALRQSSLRPAVLPSVPAGPLRADNVQIDREVVSAFDAVVPLPDGEPVRLHCRQWMDDVKLWDSKRGIEIERRVPRVEVIPVSFETF